MTAEASPGAEKRPRHEPDAENAKQWTIIFVTLIIFVLLAFVFVFWTDIVYMISGAIE